MAQRSARRERRGRAPPAQRPRIRLRSHPSRNITSDGSVLGRKLSRGLAYLEYCSRAFTDGRDLQERAHSVSDAALLADHTTHRRFRYLEMEDYVVTAVFLRDLNFLRAVDDGFCHELDELFHVGYSWFSAGSWVGSSLVASDSLSVGGSSEPASGAAGSSAGEPASAAGADSPTASRTEGCLASARRASALAAGSPGGVARPAAFFLGAAGTAFPWRRKGGCP